MPIRVTVGMNQMQIWVTRIESCTLCCQQDLCATLGHTNPEAFPIQCLRSSLRATVEPLCLMAAPGVLSDLEKSSTFIARNQQQRQEQCHEIDQVDNLSCSKHYLK